MRNEIYLKTILDTCSDAILVHDANTGKILDVNQAMLNMYGYEKKRSIKTVIKRY